MKNRLRYSGLLAVLVALLAAFAIPDRGVRVQDDDDDTQLALYMKDVNRGLRKLRATLRDPERNAESIEVVRSMEVLSVKSREEQPELVAQIPEAERAAFVTEFQVEMIELTRALTELELALVQGDNEKAKELYMTVGKLKKPAHKKFQEDDDG